MEIVFLAKVGGVVAYSLLEYWLGKTSKVKSGSVVEIIINAVKNVITSEVVKK